MNRQAVTAPTLYTMGQNRSGSRIVLIDFLRGLCLVVMTVDHLPQTLIQKFTWQGVGFFSAAECFVFLSGLVAGRVYGRMAITKGFAVLRQCALRRAAILYLSNAALMTLMVLAAMAELATLGRGFHPDWSLWSKFMLLVASPVNADILRMYCVFVLLLPAVIWALMNDRLSYVLAISGGLWLAAAQGYGMTALPEGTGYFDLMSWQLLFVAGIYFGFTPLPKLTKIGTPSFRTAVCLAVVVAFFVVRRWHFLTGQEWSPYFDWLFHWKRTLPLGCPARFRGVLRPRLPLPASPHRRRNNLAGKGYRLSGPALAASICMERCGDDVGEWARQSLDRAISWVLSSAGDRADSCQLLHSRLVARAMAGPEPENVRSGFDEAMGQRPN